MPNVKIDDVDYDFESLPEEAKKSLHMLRITEEEIQRLNARMAIAQTAKMVYAKALKEALPKPMPETIQISGLNA